LANDCLQLDHADYNVVKPATCVGDDAEKWINYYNPNTHSTEFISFWSENDDGYNYLCLSFDAAGTVVPGANFSETGCPVSLKPTCRQGPDLRWPKRDSQLSAVFR
jgi:hypothetical protein